MTSPHSSLHGDLLESQFSLAQDDIWADQEGKCSKIFGFFAQFSFITRILFTLGSLYSLVILFGWFCQYLLIMTSSFWKTDFISTISIIIFLFYSLAISNFYIVIVWEFIKFPYLRHSNPFFTIHYLLKSPVINIPCIKEYVHNDDANFNTSPKSWFTKIFNILCMIFGLIWIVFLLLVGIGGPYTYFDAINLIVLIIPLAHFILEIILYTLTFTVGLFRRNRGLTEEAIQNIRDPFVKSVVLKQVNFKICSVKFIGEVLITLASFGMICAAFSMHKNDVTPAMIALTATFWFVLVPPIFILDFPYWFLAKFPHTLFVWCKKFLENHNVSAPKKDGEFDRSVNIQNFEKSYFRQLPRISAVIYVVINMFVIILFGAWIAFPKHVENKPREIDINYTIPNNFTGNHVRSPLCYTTIHGLKPLQLMVFADDAYYNTGPNSSVDTLNNMFFYYDNITVSTTGMLTNKDSAQMFRYDAKMADNSTVTVLSIRGSTSMIDWWIDLQLFCCSLFMTVARKFAPFINKVDSHAYMTTSDIINYPFRTLLSFTIVPTYMNDLIDAYKKNQDTFSETVMFVGHSLGGALAKMMAKKFRKSSFSLSGPGITVFHGLWVPDDKKYNENFPISFIDAIPDMDLVPRVEVSGGTSYRIICELGSGICHTTSHSICMTSYMCGVNAELFCMASNLNREQLERMQHLANIDYL